jgi:hypothetical protein
MMAREDGFRVGSRTTYGALVLEACARLMDTSSPQAVSISTST